MYVEIKQCVECKMIHNAEKFCPDCGNENWIRVKYPVFVEADIDVDTDLPSFSDVETDVDTDLPSFSEVLE